MGIDFTLNQSVIGREGSIGENSNMQNRYAGDVGDFGKFGMLRCIENTGLSIRVNWYLVGNENHNNDGKYVRYIKDERYLGCDDALLASLSAIINQGTRTVLRLEQAHLLERGKYYHEVLHGPKEQGLSRSEWHQIGMKQLNDCDLVFLDPDNGLLPKSVGRGSDKSRKYVIPEEIVDYYKAGHSVVFYSHRTREKLDVYLKHFMGLFDTKKFETATIKGISFKRGTIRDYFFIVHSEHSKKIESSLSMMLHSKWMDHFSLIHLPDK